MREPVGEEMPGRAQPFGDAGKISVSPRRAVRAAAAAAGRPSLQPLPQLTARPDFGLTVDRGLRGVPVTAQVVRSSPKPERLQQRKLPLQVGHRPGRAVAEKIEHRLGACVEPRVRLAFRQRKQQERGDRVRARRAQSRSPITAHGAALQRFNGERPQVLLQPRAPG